MTEDREIKKIRLRMIDLIKSFYTGEPDAEKLSRWRGTFSALSRERVTPQFDQNVRDLYQCLEQRSLTDLQEEYYSLFTDPFNDNQLNMSASYYLDGKTYGETLVEIRSLFLEAGLEKNSDVIETEDSLVVMLDVLSMLISEDAEEHDADTRLQSELLQKYLLPFSECLKEACETNSAAEFYACCGKFFCGYLELEKDLYGSEVVH